MDDKFKYNPNRNEVFGTKDKPGALGSMGFTQFPNILFIHLMRGRMNARKPLLPHSFVVFFMTLWHGVMEQPKGYSWKPNWSTQIAMRQFPFVHHYIAARWACALDNSNLFTVTFDEKKEMGATFVYNDGASATDWEGFADGLVAALAEERRLMGKRGGYLPMDEWGEIVLRCVAVATNNLIDEIGGSRGKIRPGYAEKLQKLAERMHENA